TCDLTNHLNRKFKCNQTQIPNPVHPPNPNISRPQLPVSNSLSPVVYVREKEGFKRGQATHLSIEDLANWLANSEIKNNPTIINKKFDLMEESSSKWQKKTKISQPIEEDFEAKPGPTTQAYRKRQRKDRRKETPAPEIIDQRDESEKDPKDLDKKVPWPVLFPDKEWYWEVWQNGIQYAKDMFKVDGAEYAFSTWFIDTEEHKLEAEMTKERAREILNTIDNSKYLIRVKFIRADIVISDKKTKRGFKIIDKYEPFRKSKKAGGKYVRGGPNVILTKKTKPGFWVGIDKKFLVREVRAQSEDSTLNCIAERVIEHFDQAKRGYGLTKICRQKINDWEKKIRIPGAQVHDIAELEKILKRPITLLDITHGSQAIWLMGVGDRTQRISQFVLEDGRTFRTWKKHIEIIEVCKQLVNDAINWQYQENIINEKKRSILLESLKVVDLAEQVFGANHAGSRLANEINEWYPISGKINDDIKRACVEYGH
ncbi:3622_t:CDS:2, partial [Gigaspora margarita]